MCQQIISKKPKALNYNKNIKELCINHSDSLIMGMWPEGCVCQCSSDTWGTLHKPAMGILGVCFCLLQGKLLCIFLQPELAQHLSDSLILPESLYSAASLNFTTCWPPLHLRLDVRAGNNSPSRRSQAWCISLCLQLLFPLSVLLSVNTAHSRA